MADQRARLARCGVRGAIVTNQEDMEERDAERACT